MSVFAVYGDWKSEHALSAGAQVAVVSNLADIDAEACVWVEAQAPDVLRLSVDVDAATYEDALAVGRSALVEAASASGVPGRLLRASASTEDGYVVWVAEEDE